MAVPSSGSLPQERIRAKRDVTATVESLPLIVSSILGKKLACGLDALVMDVKSGNGAFMPSHQASTELAEAIARVASREGTPRRAILLVLDSFGIGAGPDAERFGDEGSDTPSGHWEIAGVPVLALGGGLIGPLGGRETFADGTSFLESDATGGP